MDVQTFPPAGWHVPQLAWCYVVYDAVCIQHRIRYRIRCLVCDAVYYIVYDIVHDIVYDIVHDIVHDIARTRYSTFSWRHFRSVKWWGRASVERVCLPHLSQVLNLSRSLLSCLYTILYRHKPLQNASNTPSRSHPDRLFTAVSPPFWGQTASTAPSYIWNL